MANFSLRIPIPRNTDDLLKLGDSIYKKHQADGKASPLNSMQDYNWNTDGPKIAAAFQKNAEAQAAAKLAEKLFRERDALMPDVKGIVTSTRDVLKGTFKKSPKSLGDWGYTVDDTPKAAKKPATT